MMNAVRSEVHDCLYDLKRSKDAIKERAGSFEIESRHGSVLDDPGQGFASPSEEDGCQNREQDGAA